MTSADDVSVAFCRLWTCGGGVDSKKSKDGNERRRRLTSASARLCFEGGSLFSCAWSSWRHITLEEKVRTSSTEARPTRTAPDGREPESKNTCRARLQHGRVRVDDGREVLVLCREPSDASRVLPYRSRGVRTCTRIAVEELHLLPGRLEVGLGIQGHGGRAVPAAGVRDDPEVGRAGVFATMRPRGYVLERIKTHRGLTESLSLRSARVRCMFCRGKHAVSGFTIRDRTCDLHVQIISHTNTSRPAISSL